MSQFGPVVVVARAQPPQFVYEVSVWYAGATQHFADSVRVFVQVALVAMLSMAVARLARSQIERVVEMRRIVSE